MGEALCDRFSFRRFCGFGLEEDLPDTTMILRFCHALIGKTRHLVNDEFAAQGVVMGRGAILDETILRSSAKDPKGREVSETDPEAGWTKKNGDYIHGYKAHMAVDDKEGLVQEIVTTSADVLDSQVFGVLLTGEEESVYADKAYDSQANRKRLEQAGTKDCLLYKASKNKPLLWWQRWLNKLYAPVRQRIERTFAHWKWIFGLSRARYKRWEKNQVRFDLLATVYNLRRSLKIMQTG